MYKQLIICLLTFLITINCKSQTQITEIIKDKHSFRVYTKKVDSTELLIALSRDDSLHVYENLDDQLIKRDTRYYPDLFNDLTINFSENYLLASNLEGSIAYNFKNFSEFFIPYSDNNNITQWIPNHKDQVSLIQRGGLEYNRFIVDLNEQEVNKRPTNETLLNLSDKYMRLRREFENEDDETHILTNLSNMDSISINTGRLYGGYSDFNDHFFVYRKGNEIIKVDNIDFTISSVTDIPDDATSLDIQLIDDYIFIVYTTDFSNREISIFDRNNNLLKNLQIDSNIRYVFNAVVNNNILFSSYSGNLSAFNLTTGEITDIHNNFNYSLKHLDDESLFSYSNTTLYLISKDDLKIKSYDFGTLNGSILGHSMSQKDGSHILSLDVRNGSADALFEITNNTVEPIFPFDNFYSGISYSSDILTNNDLSKLILVDENNKYIFDEQGYTQISNNPTTFLFINTYKIDHEKICWSENIEFSNYKIKCFSKDEIIDYGIIPNISGSSTNNSLRNFTIQNEKILYLRTTSSFQNQLKVLNSENGQDSLIGELPFTHNFVDIYNQPFINLSDSLYTYDFHEDKLINLQIPLTNTFSMLEFANLEDKTYVASQKSVYEIDGFISKNIYTSTNNIYRPTFFGKYLAIDAENYIFYDGTTTTELILADDEDVNFLGGDFVEIANTSYNNFDPSEIYNLKTQEKSQLNDDFSDRNIEFILPVKDSLIMVSKTKINGQSFFSFDKFYDNFSTHKNIMIFPALSNNTIGKFKVLESEEYFIVVIENSIFYIKKSNGEIIDNISISGLIDHQEISNKGTTLYFIKYTSNSGNQVFKYEPTILNTNNPDNNRFKVIVYPNPSMHLLTIEAEQNIKEWTLYSEQGKQVMQGNHSDKSLTIDISSLSKGLYFINISSNGKSEIKKILKI